jgi:hypothetical protein
LSYILKKIYICISRSFLVINVCIISERLYAHPVLPTCDHTLSFPVQRAVLVTEIGRFSINFMAQATSSFHDLASPVGLTKPRGGRPDVRGFDSRRSGDFSFTLTFVTVYGLTRPPMQWILRAVCQVLRIHRE